MGTKISKSRVRNSERNLGKVVFCTSREIIMPKVPLTHSPTSEPLPAPSVMGLAFEIGDWSNVPETSCGRKSQLPDFDSQVKAEGPVAQNETKYAVSSPIKSRAPAEPEVPDTPSGVGSEEPRTPNWTGPDAFSDLKTPADSSETELGEYAASAGSEECVTPIEENSSLTSFLLQPYFSVYQNSPHENLKILIELLHQISKFPVPLQMLPLSQENEKMLRSSLRFLESLRHVKDEASQTESECSGTLTEYKCLPDGAGFCPNKTNGVSALKNASSSESLTNTEKSSTDNGLSLICEICYDEISMYNEDFDLSWDRHCQKLRHLLAYGPTEKENPLVIPPQTGASGAQVVQTTKNAVRTGNRQKPNSVQQLSHRSKNSLSAPSSSCPPEPVPFDEDYKSIRRAKLTFGKMGDGNGEFLEPWGICYDLNKRLIVADSGNNRIQIFKADGTFLLKFGMKGTMHGHFRRPTGVASDYEGRIIVADTDNHRIQIFNQNGKFISMFGRSGSEPGCFLYPWDVDVNAEGEILVSDSGNCRIQMFSRDGHFLFKWGTHKFSTCLRGVCINSADRIIAADNHKRRVSVIEADNLNWDLVPKKQRDQRKNRYPCSFDSPQGVAMDSVGRIFVALAHQIEIYTSDGIFLCGIGWPTIEMHSPSGLCVTPDRMLIVADSVYNRVRIFKL